MSWSGEPPDFSIGRVELQQNALLEARLETDVALANPEVMSHSEGTTRKTLHSGPRRFPLSGSRRKQQELLVNT